MGISHGDFWGHSEGREASCIIIQDLDIFRSGFRSFFCLSELSNSSRKRLEAVGQLLCTDAIRCLYICTARSGSVQSLRFLDSVASVSGNFRKMQYVLQTQSARGKLISRTLTLTQLDLSTGLEMNVASFGR